LPWQKTGTAGAFTGLSWVRQSVPCKLATRTLALMHGPAFAGDGAAALQALADDYDRRLSDLAGFAKL
jgi:hypothetical protein